MLIILFQVAQRGDIIGATNLIYCTWRLLQLQNYKRPDLTAVSVLWMVGIKSRHVINYSRLIAVVLFQVSCCRDGNRHPEMYHGAMHTAWG